MPHPVNPLFSLADARDRIEADGPMTLTQLSAQNAVLEAAVVTLAATSPNREPLMRWLALAGTEAEYDTEIGHAIRTAARELADRLAGL